MFEIMDCYVENAKIKKLEGHHGHRIRFGDMMIERSPKI